MRATVAEQASTGTADGGRSEAGPWLTMPRLWLVVVLGGIGAMELAQVPSAVDLAYHVKAGELMVAERLVLRTDVFAWTTVGRPWLDQNWGAQVALYGIWRLGGFPLLTAANALFAVATWGLVAPAGRDHDPGRARGARGRPGPCAHARAGPRTAAPDGVAGRVGALGGPGRGLVRAGAAGGPVRARPPPPTLAGRR